MSRIELHSPIPPERCVTVLQAAIVNDWKWEGLAAGKWVAGSVSRTSLKLRKRSILSNNSFRTYLYASLEPEGLGTRLSVRSGLHPLVIVFLTLWFTGALLGSAIAFIEKLHHPGAVPWPVLGLPLMGVAVVVIGRFFAYGDRAYLLDFLTTTLRAEPVKAPPGN